MSHLTLKFISVNEPILYRVEFSHSLLKKPIHSRRGKGDHISTNLRSFQWTSAVQAFCILALRQCAWGAANGNIDSANSPVLIGGAGSAASALDYALSKEPDWLRDMFGVDRRGHSLSRRLIRRINAERKSPGPVCLSWKEHELAASQIKVILNETPIEDQGLLETMADTIHRVHFENPRIEVVLDSDEAPDNSPPLITDRARVFEMLKKEIRHAVTTTDIFSPAAMKSAVREVGDEPLISSVVKDPRRFTNQIDLELGMSERLGIAQESYLRDNLSSNQTITCALPVSVAGSMALFQLLRSVKGFNVTMDYRHPYAIELCRKIRTDAFAKPPDLCIMGSSPAATLISLGKKLAYKPLMFMPKFSHRLILPRGRTGEHTSFDQRDYFLICDELSTDQIFLRRLIERERISPKRITSTHTEPNEIPNLLASDCREIGVFSFFPYYPLYEGNASWAIAPRERDGSNDHFTVLFAHEEFLADRDKARALNIALRSAWLELREDNLMINRIAHEIAYDPEYSKLIGRFSGLSALAA